MKPSEQDETIASVIFIRCLKHLTIPQQNKNEHSGGECGGCIAEERDQLKTELETVRSTVTRLESENKALLIALKNLMPTIRIARLLNTRQRLKQRLKPRRN